MPPMKRFTLILIPLLICLWLYLRLRAWQRDTFYQCTMKMAGDRVPRWYV